MSSHLKIVMFLLLGIRMNLFFLQMEYILKISMAFRYNVPLQKPKNVCGVCVCVSVVFLFYYDSTSSYFYGSTESCTHVWVH